MTAIGRLVRTTAFKLLAVYLVIFTLFAAGLIFYFARNAGELIVRQHVDVVNEESRIVERAYQRGGMRRVVGFVDRASRRPGPGIYLITDPSGATVAGNIEGVPPDFLESPGIRPASYQSFNEDGELETHPAILRTAVLPGGFRLVIGRDVGDAERLRGIVRRATSLSVILMLGLGLLGSLFISRRVLTRIDGISGAAENIMAGNLSQRLPVMGTADEFDRLSDSLNTMLTRIEGLMTGLKEVSDNVAHDLKTPLTRTRTRIEAVLREKNTSAVAYRAALEETLAECDDLIGTFNALLSIARAEAGEGAGFERFDAAAMVRDMAEIYEPAAEEKALIISVDAPDTVVLTGNRQLVGQALANLLDNALKYGAVEDGKVSLRLFEHDGRVSLSVADSGPGISEADRARVQERFVRLDAARSAPGSGLGLSLVRAVARLHGGTLDLGDNTPGLIATLHLPLTPPVTTAIEASSGGGS